MDVYYYNIISISKQVFLISLNSLIKTITSILILSSFLLSENISGTITDQSSGEPLPYTNIILLENNRGTATDISGYYIIPNIDFGTYTMKIMMIGYTTLEKSIELGPESGKFNFELLPEPIVGNEIKVSAERTRFDKRVDISRVNISNQEIRKAPAFVEADLFRTLQLLPSVSASNDFNAALIVRGGSPDENLILLDGTEIYNPYHIGGVFSTFNADMISDAEFLAGGFPAKYGGRLSSVLSITGREGDSKNGRLPQSLNGIKKYWDFSGASGNISLLSSKILTEGSLYKGSWMFSARRTYFDKFVDMYYDYNNEDPPGNYYFWDTHLKLKFAPNNTNQFFYSQFSGKDNLFLEIGGAGFPGIDFGWDWGNGTQNITWKFIPNSNYFLKTRLSKTTYQFNVDFAIDFNPDVADTTEIINLDSGESTDLSLYLDNLVEDSDFNQELKYIVNESLNFDFGWQIKNLSLKYTETFAGQQVTNISSTPKTTSSFININWSPYPLLKTIFGFRISKFNGYDKFLINPKFSLKYNPISDLAIKASIGRYSQFLYTINQEEELLRIVDFWQPIPEGKKPQEADHIIVGLEYWMSQGNTMSLESYYKNYSTIYDINPKVNATNIESTLAIQGTGKAMGIEYLYRFKKNNLS
ncbi:MAG: TonB-dependent receptor, partial [Candidatus Marinimicrobia bacterium]|nr:TonB-dependent receptor [Candidatus Neomarinimicrobiota bacterium]